MGYGDTIQRVLQGDYTNATPEERTKAVKEIITVCAVAASAVTVQPIPFVDTALISPIQIAMVQAIGKIHGFKLDRRAILEMLSTFGASIVAQNILMAAAKFVPFLGWLVAISMAYALTYAIGEVSDAYYRSGRGIPSAEMKEMFQRIYKEKKAEKQASAEKNASLKERLEQLKQAFDAGHLTAEEFEKKKEEILASF